MKLLCILLAFFLFYSCATYNNTELSNQIVKSKSDSWESVNKKINDNEMIGGRNLKIRNLIQ